MASYNAPLNKNGTFNNSDFNFQNNLTSSQQLSKYYVQYPITQGALSVKGNLAVNGTATISNSLVLSKPTTAPTTWIAPIAGQIGFQITGATTNTYNIITGSTTSLSSVFLSVGVWHIYYKVLINTLPTVGTVVIGLASTTLAIANGQSTVMGGAVSTSPVVSGSYILSFATAGSYYLLTNAVFTSGSYIVNTGDYTLTATRIA